MSLHYQDDWLTVHHGDCREVMAGMPAESVHCVVTSPPYWGLRDYGSPGQLGLERTPEEYVANLVAVFREVRRVLRADGTVWLNLGDSYAGSEPGRRDTEREIPRTDGSSGLPSSKAPTGRRGNVMPLAGLKPKDLVGIPWRVAFALQADGWYLRSDIIWSKPNPMPESVTDRPTKSHEYVFLLSKSPRYYFDADAVRGDIAHVGPGLRDSAANGMTQTGRHDVLRKGEGRTVIGDNTFTANPAGRNIRSVWTIATAPYPGAHFATFPLKLVEPCIKAGTSEKGVCPECGTPWVREVERTLTGVDEVRRARSEPDGRMPNRTRAGDPTSTTTGWRPGCRCEHGGGGWVPIGATVLDPFAGSGTTGMVAQSLSRRAVLIDLSLDYLGQLMDRNADIPLGLGA